MHTPTGCVHFHIDITKSEGLGEKQPYIKSTMTSICVIFGVYKPDITKKKLAKAYHPQTVSSIMYCSYLHLFTRY